MKKEKLILPFLLLLLSLVPAALAETFQGEVTSVDSAKGTVNVRYTNSDGQVIAEKTFYASPGNALTASGAQSLNDIQVGDKIQLNAFNRNGNWEIQSFASTNSAGAANGLLPGSTNNSASVFAASPRNQTLPISNGFAPSNADRPVFTSTTSGTGMLTPSNNSLSASGSLANGTGGGLANSGGANLSASGAQGASSASPGANAGSAGSAAGTGGGTSGGGAGAGGGGSV